MNVIYMIKTGYKQRIEKLRALDKQHAWVRHRELQEAQTSDDLKKRYIDFTKGGSNLPEDLAIIHARAKDIIAQAEKEQQESFTALSADPSPIFRYCKPIEIDVNVDNDRWADEGEDSSDDEDDEDSADSLDNEGDERAGLGKENEEDGGDGLATEDATVPSIEPFAKVVSSHVHLSFWQLCLTCQYSGISG